MYLACFLSARECTPLFPERRQIHCGTNIPLARREMTDAAVPVKAQRRLDEHRQSVSSRTLRRTPEDPAAHAVLLTNSPSALPGASPPIVTRKRTGLPFAFGPSTLPLNSWAFGSQLKVGGEAAVCGANRRIAYRFHARDQHLRPVPASRQRRFRPSRHRQHPLRRARRRRGRISSP